MAQALTAALPDDLDLPQGYTIVFAAIDPDTGADVTGVTVSNAQIHCENVGAASSSQLQVGAFMLVPGPEA